MLTHWNVPVCASRDRLRDQGVQDMRKAYEWAGVAPHENKLQHNGCGGCRGRAGRPGYGAQSLPGEARAVGESGGQTIESPADSFATELEPLVSALAIAASGKLDIAGGEAADKADAGDTVTYQFTVTNEGNVEIEGVQPSLSVTAGDASGEGEIGAFQPQSADIAGGESQEFTVTYRVAQTDVLRAAGRDAGLSAVASVAGTGHAGAVSAEAVAAVSVAADPRLAITVETTLEKAEGNRRCERRRLATVSFYVYTVTNTGNVPISECACDRSAWGPDTELHHLRWRGRRTVERDRSATADVLEGQCADAGGTDGSWDTLGAGGAICVFLHPHGHAGRIRGAVRERRLKSGKADLATGNSSTRSRGSRHGRPPSGAG